MPNTRFGHPNKIKKIRAIVWNADLHFKRTIKLNQFLTPLGSTISLYK